MVLRKPPDNYCQYSELVRDTFALGSDVAYEAVLCKLCGAESGAVEQKIRLLFFSVL